MASLGHLDDCFVRIAQIIPLYRPRQIASRWRNKLDPQLSPEPLTTREKIFINNKIRNCEMDDEHICWREIVRDLEIAFGRRHTDNKLRNYRNSILRIWKRNRENLAMNQFNRAPIEPKFVPKFIDCPFRMNPMF
ncbi:hypothetical protein C1645_736218 [Glomus cerebriforme]|uniref:HTH myb-type domain-containing protein n=1 Tax=Glomus cerebriforme TaxID=658196 RepID=A0A397T8N2_9GLOM|nr:hypothetical protein C1645_736218 [Glomus cerebriforme]